MIDPKSLGDLTVGVVAIFFLYMIIRMQVTMVNKVVQDNTKAINRLANTLEKGSVQEENFRKHLTEVSEETRSMVIDINRKLEAHGKVVAKHEV